ncbi:MAG: DUF4399 domain-containing protein [Myxococcota bacterium]
MRNLIGRGTVLGGPRATRVTRAVAGLSAAFGLIGLVALTVHFGALPAQAASGIPRSDRPDEAYVYFISPSDGETVTSPVTVRFGLGQMGVAPAGTQKAGTGHHHLIVDAELPPVDLPVPKNANYRHFGAGQTEVALELTPGKHTLQLLLADHIHVPHDPPVVSPQITINVMAKE